MSDTLRAAAVVAGAAAWGLACAAAMAAGALPPARPIPGQVVDPSRFQRIDPAFEDAGPLRMSLRELSVDLRHSDDFSNVYRIPGVRPDGADDRFARRSGGLTAVFPRSVYMSMGGAVVAEIPPGTVFYIDGVPAPLPWEVRDFGGMGIGGAGETRGMSAGQRVDTAVNSSVRAAEGRRSLGEFGESTVEGEEGPVAEFVGVRALLLRAVEAR